MLEITYCLLHFTRRVILCRGKKKRVRNGKFPIDKYNRRPTHTPVGIQDYYSHRQWVCDFYEPTDSTSIKISTPLVVVPVPVSHSPFLFPLPNKIDDEYQTFSTRLFSPSSSQLLFHRLTTFDYVSIRYKDVSYDLPILDTNTLSASIIFIEMERNYEPHVRKFFFRRHRKPFVSPFSATNFLQQLPTIFCCHFIRSFGRPSTVSSRYTI